MEGGLIRQALNLKMNERRIPVSILGNGQLTELMYVQHSEYRQKDKRLNLLLSTILRPLQQLFFLKDIRVLKVRILPLNIIQSSSTGRATNILRKGLANAPVVK